MVSSPSISQRASLRDLGKVVASGTPKRQRIYFVCTPKNGNEQQIEVRLRSEGVPHYARDRAASMAGLSVRELVEVYFLDVQCGTSTRERDACSGIYCYRGRGCVSKAEHVLKNGW